MATKKTVKKAEPRKKVKKVKEEKVPVISEELIAPEVKEAKEACPQARDAAREKKTQEKYFYAVGRRKTSIAQVKLFVTDKKETSIEVNKKELEKYFSLLRLQTSAKAPLALAGDMKFFVSVHVAFVFEQILPWCSLGPCCSAVTAVLSIVLQLGIQV